MDILRDFCSGEAIAVCFMGEDMTGVPGADSFASFRKFGDDLDFFGFSLGGAGEVGGGASFSFLARDFDLDLDPMPKKRDLDFRGSSGSGSGTSTTSGSLTRALCNSFCS